MSRLDTKHSPLITSAKVLRAFTLIEMLVAITLFAIVGTIGTDIFLSVVRSSNKANIIAELERNGNAALAMMSTEIRNARDLDACSGSSCTITNQDSIAVTFSRVTPSGENGYVARNNNPITDTARASGVNITSLSFVASASAPPVVTITLGLSQPVGAPGRIDYRASTTLTTTVSLRTY